MQQRLFDVSYITCCKDFVDFKIELFIKTDSFELTSIDCDWTREYQIHVDSHNYFVCRGVMYLNDSGNMFDSSGDDESIKLVKDYAFGSSLCFTQTRTLHRFCIHCQDVFLMFHTLSNDVFSSP